MAVLGILAYVVGLSPRIDLLSSLVIIVRGCFLFCPCQPRYANGRTLWSKQVAQP